MRTDDNNSNSSAAIHSASTAESEAGGNEIAKLGLTGGVLLVACLAGVALADRTKGVEFLAFVFLVAAAPPLAALLLFAEGRPRFVARLWLCVRLFLGLVLIGVLGLGGFEYASKTALPNNWPFLAVVSGSAAVAAAVLCMSRLAELTRRLDVLIRLDALLILLLTTVVVFFGPFDPSLGTSAVVDYLTVTPRFFWWWAAGLLFVGGAILMCRFESKVSIPYKKLINTLVLFAFGLFVLSLFNDELFLDVRHYMAYVGPAMHAYHGGYAMVDVFCQYGLMPWLAIKAGFSAAAPTFGTAALVVRLSMLAYLFSIGVILYAVSRWRLSAFCLMVPFLLVAITFHPNLYDLNALPSTTGLRYLVPTLMVVVLTTVSSPVIAHWLAAVLLALASLWSIESFAYTLAPWGYVLFLRVVRTRSIGTPAAVLLAGFAMVLLAHVVFALGTYATAGESTDYRPYLDLFGGFRPDKSGDWSRLVNPNFAVWAPLWLSHFLVLAVALYRALRGRAPTDCATRLVPVAAYGLATMTYFSGWPHWSSLGLAFLPLAVVMIQTLQALVVDPRRYGSIGMAALAALAVVSATLVAFGAERFARPALSHQGNRTVLRRCFAAEGCQLAAIPERLKQGIQASPLDPVGPIYHAFRDEYPNTVPLYQRERDQEGYRRIVELVSISRDLAPNEPRMNVLADSYEIPYVSMVALMETGQWYSWPISSPENDEPSPGIWRLVSNSVQQSLIRDGELLVVADGDRLMKSQQGILELVTARCRLEPVETRAFHSVFRLENCAPPVESGKQ